MTGLIFLDIKGVCETLSICESGVRTLINRGEFPRPRKLTDRRVAWLTSEIEDWAAKRPVSDLPPVA